MSRTSIDARRSIHKYVTEFLPDDFDVRISIDQEVWERPSAVVQYAGPQALTGGPKVYEATRPFVVYAWPTKDEDVEQSELNALDIEEAFVQTLQIGGVLGGRPRRIPLFDYDGVGRDEAIDPDAELDGYLRVLDCSTDTRRDPDDDRAWTVLMNLRVRWSRLGEPKEELQGPIMEGFKIHATGT